MYSSPNIITVIKSRRMRRADYVARRKIKRNSYRVLVRKAKEKRDYGNVGVNGKIILRCVLNK